MISNPEKALRVHLKQAILVGYGEEARYAKVLIGRRDATADYIHHATVFQSFIIIGFVHGYRDHNVAQPTQMYLADDNILCIEDCKIDPPRCERGQCHRVTVMHGTPETLWAMPGPRQVSSADVWRARRIIQLREDGSYHIVKDMRNPLLWCRPMNEVIFLYDEES
jgi:hypothetical protein